MNTIAITGSCGEIGSAIRDRLAHDGFQTKNWCRCCGVDLKKRIPEMNVNGVVHVAELGPDVLGNLLKAIPANPDFRFVLISSVHVMMADDDYAQSKREQERILIKFAVASKIRANVLRLGHIAGTKAWPVFDPSRIPEIPLSCFGCVSDVAEAASYLVSSNWSCGSILTLDGGMSAMRLKL